MQASANACIRVRANMAHVKHFRPPSALGFQVTVFETFLVVLLRSEAAYHTAEPADNPRTPAETNLSPTFAEPTCPSHWQEQRYCPAVSGKGLKTQHKLEPSTWYWSHGPGAPR
jgi:hypothetical protein